MSQLYAKPLPVGKTGNYTLTIDGGWLGQETITSQTITTDTDEITVGLDSSANNVIQVYLTGVSVGRHEVHFEWTTATRSDCTTCYVDVVEC